MSGIGASAGIPPKRLSTAAQFFTEEDEVPGDSVMEPQPVKKSTYDRVVELLNQASLLPKVPDKIGNLKQVQELIIHKDPDLLDNFLDEMIAFQSDRSADVKKCIIGFMEEACKKDVEYLPRITPSIAHLFRDENISVQKRVILSFISLYRSALMWVSKAKVIRAEMSAVWDQFNQMKAAMVEMLDSDNDGIRTHIVKFLEGMTLTLARKTADSEIPKNQENEVSLDQITENNRLIRIKKLEEEGRNHFLMLVQFQGSAHISSINLMTVMGALTNIARQRPVFFDQVVQSFEALHVNLPPTLAKSQVSSVRKNLKMQMLSLLRHPMSADFVPQITTLLTDLGASQSEISKALPKEDSSRKRKIVVEEPGISGKRAKIEVLPEIDDDDDIGMTPWTDRSKQPTGSQRQTAIDITAEELLPRLAVQNVADLVLLSMVMLPDAMPAQFQSTYTPIAAAGTESQIKHISRLLATQLTMAGMGRGVGELKLQMMKTSEEPDDGGATPYSQGSSPKQVIQTVVGGLTMKEEEERAEIAKKAEFLAPVKAPPPRKGMRQFKLEAVTKPLDPDKLDSMTVAIFKRIMDSERMATINHIQAARAKILTCLTAQFGGRLKDMLEDYIFDDLRNRYDLAFSWLYQEYTHCQGFSSFCVPGKNADMASYDECLTRLLKNMSEMSDQREGLFHRLILEAPVITPNSMHIIRRYCANEEHIQAGMKTLQDLILIRPKNRLEFLDLILAFTSSEKPEIRNPAIQTVQKLYCDQHLQQAIQEYAVRQLKLLLAPKPEVDPKRWPVGVDSETWGEETIKAHLYLYLGLLPTNHVLIHELANIYTATSADIKRTILRVLEGPVKGMGMDSPELLRLVENCPKGSETLVMRVIHILTDKVVPSPELVDRIRDLYHKRVPDVRFLIPVLNGLSKAEVISALPKLIKLNPMVVKEVFNRLMGAHISANASYVSPLTPDELLIALHNIDPVKCDMKTIIKAANLCFSEKRIYTEEVLAIVMQRLTEQTPLPTLLMRTVIQSLSMYPRLIGLILNILQRLIVKQVWNQKKVWEGFIKCCQRTKPQSFQVLLQLPPDQLSDVFQVSPELRIPLLTHVQSFTPLQLAHIPEEIMRVLQTEPVPKSKEETVMVEQIVPQPEPEPEPPGTVEEALPSAISVVVPISSTVAHFKPPMGEPRPVTISTATHFKPPMGEPRPITTITAERRARQQLKLKDKPKPEQSKPELAKIEIISPKSDLLPSEAVSNPPSETTSKQIPTMVLLAEKTKPVGTLVVSTQKKSALEKIIPVEETSVSPQIALDFPSSQPEMKSSRRPGQKLPLKAASADKTAAMVSSSASVETVVDRLSNESLVLDHADHMMHDEGRTDSKTDEANMSASSYESPEKSDDRSVQMESPEDKTARDSGKSKSVRTPSKAPSRRSTRTKK